MNTLESNDSSRVIELFLFKEFEDPENPGKQRAMLVETAFGGFPERKYYTERKYVGLFQSKHNLHFQAIMGYRNDEGEAHTYESLVDWLSGLRDARTKQCGPQLIPRDIEEIIPIIETSEHGKLSKALARIHIVRHMGACGYEAIAVILSIPISSVIQKVIDGGYLNKPYANESQHRLALALMFANEYNPPNESNNYTLPGECYMTNDALEILSDKLEVNILVFGIAQDDVMNYELRYATSAHIASTGSFFVLLD